MSYYVIGIGGTGAKCVEALTHLCAAGLMPDGDLYSIFVDPDKSNGNLGRAEITLQQYANCKQLALGSTNLFKTKISIGKPDVWSPFDNEPHPKLDDFFRYNSLKLTEKAAANLFDVLYSNDEKTTTLDEGFRGHPSIGAAIMARTLELGSDEDEPWKTFRDKLREDVKARAGAKVMLVGSIFGGTGASGVPTIARLIREELKKIGQSKARVGGVLMLPYFSFAPVHKETLKADAANFLLNTQAALKYYYQQNDLNIFDAVYLLGDEALSPIGESSIGGKTQNNEPHYLELYAALACIDLFMRDDVKDYQMIARHDAGRAAWGDLPYATGSEKLKQHIDQLTRFAFAYLCTYYPMLENINRKGGGYRAPWYIDYFERNKIDLSKAIRKELVYVKEYCESFLRWLANIQTSAKGIDVDLINYTTFSRMEAAGERQIVNLLPASNFRIEEFANLTLPHGKDDPHALSRFWKKICNAKVKDKNADGVGKFIHALYRECSEKVSPNDESGA